MSDPACLLRLADQLGKVTTGSPEADRTIHDALDQTGEPLAYTRDTQAVRTLLPAEFKERPSVGGAGQVYAACRRIGF
jgi:hypothetical protein